MKWKDWTGGQRLFFGIVHVATAYWDGLTPRDEPNKYAVASRLPGLNLTGHYATINEAKAAAERGAAGWLQAAGLSTNETADDETNRDGDARGSSSGAGLDKP